MARIGYPINNYSLATALTQFLNSATKLVDVNKRDAGKRTFVAECTSLILVIKAFQI